jgi:hypothetical protein
MVASAVTGATLLGAMGGSLLNTLAASADTAGSAATTTTTTAADTANQPGGRTGGDPSQGGHVGTNGVKEVVLTGDAATKATAAAQAAVPGSTVLRVENDAEGATYEAHIKKADGSMVTVKMDANFKVTSTEDGMR